MCTSKSCEMCGCPESKIQVPGGRGGATCRVFPTALRNLVQNKPYAKFTVATFPVQNTPPPLLPLDAIPSACFSFRKGWASCICPTKPTQTPTTTFGIQGRWLPRSAPALPHTLTRCWPWGQVRAPRACCSSGIALPLLPSLHAGTRLPPHPFGGRLGGMHAACGFPEERLQSRRSLTPDQRSCSCLFWF